MNLLRTPRHLLVLIILVLSVVGAYSVRSSMLDVFSLLVFGLVGYILRKLEFSLAPLVLGLVLGPLVEKYFRESLFLANGDLAIFVSSPITVVLWGGVGLIMIGSVVGPRIMRARRRRHEQPTRNQPDPTEYQQPADTTSEEKGN